MQGRKSDNAESINQELYISRRHVLSTIGLLGAAGLSATTVNAQEADCSRVSRQNGQVKFDFNPGVDRDYITSIARRGTEDQEYQQFSDSVRVYPRDGTDDRNNAYTPQEIRSCSVGPNAYSITRKYENPDGQVLDVTALCTLPEDGQALIVDLEYQNESDEQLTIDTPPFFAADGTPVGEADITNPAGTYRFYVSDGFVERFANVSSFTVYEPAGDIPFLTAFDDEHGMSVGLLRGATPVSMGIVNQETQVIRLQVEGFMLAPDESKRWRVAIGAHSGGQDAPNTAQSVMDDAKQHQPPIIAQYDTDGDGKINQEELLSALANYNGDAPRTDAATVNGKELLKLLAAYNSSV